jgi:DNA polymerase-3 subunit epsilon
MNWDQRFIVFDCETTGLDPVKDHLISIGAIAVEDGEISLGDTFETLVQVPYNSPSVVVHGITRETAQEQGLEEVEAVRRFLSFAAGSVLVGHHVGFDLAVVRRVAREGLSAELPNSAIDTMDLALELEKQGAFPSAQAFDRFDLDGLCERFSIEPHDRHTAPGDAFITAQIFLKLMRAGKKVGISPHYL